MPDAQTQELSARIVELAHRRRRFGYRRIHDLLRAEGRHVNHKRVWRLYSEASGDPNRWWAGIHQPGPTNA